MKIEVEVFKLFRLGEDLDSRNWLKGIVFMKTNKGNVPMEISHRHLSWWQGEFGLTMFDINRLIAR